MEHPIEPQGAGGVVAYSLLQQQLVQTRARMDRQLGQLIRLNRLSDELVNNSADMPLAQQFAEAVVDVMDVAIGAVWVFGHDARVEMAVCGVPVDISSWQAAGREIVDELRATSVTHASSLGPHWLARLPGQRLVDPIVCPCIGDQGHLHALILASNTDRVAGMNEPTADETLEVFTLIAEKLSAHSDALAIRRLTDEQILRVRESERRLSLVLKGTNDGWWDWELATDACFVSQRWLEMLGIEQEGEVLQGLWLARVHPDQRPQFDALLTAALAGTATAVERELRLRREDGSYLPVLMRATITRNDGGDPIRFTGTILDLTERHRQEQQIRHLAFYDPLTDLPNRRLIMQRLEEAVTLNTQSGQCAAVLMLDLDRFKSHNDTHGHAAGDELLVATARRLQSVVHGAGMVGRLSGDEFVVLMSRAGEDSSAAEQAALRTAHDIRAALEQPFTLEVGTVYQSTSIGITVACGGADVDTVLHEADVAMYSAKTRGRNEVRVFEKQLQARVEESARFEHRVRQAFRGDELTLHYQPQVDEAGVLQGTEALLRWIPPDGEQIPTERIIASAEESGLIYELGMWILQRACEQASLWRSDASCRVSVNLGAGEFLHPQFPQRVLSVLEATGVPGSAVRLEITEATVVSDLEFAAAHMQQLRTHGVEFSLDDFGTGYSSLTYLRRLPLSEVKLDRSYITHLPHSWQDLAIVEAVVKLCTTLGFRVVAEGVETAEQLAALRSFGCRIFQGHLIGRPQPPPATPQAMVVPPRR